ncbi:MAG: putative peptidoglycan glycosyltransferase FtsW [Candidatus Paceibacterota bacterium]
MANKAKNKPNMALLVSIFLLTLIGVLALTTASAPLSLKSGNSPAHYLFNQLIRGLIPGLILGFIAFKIPLNFYKKYSLLFFIGASLLTLAVFIPAFSETQGGATRWLNLGFTSFQPSEFLKLATILYLSAILSSARPMKKRIPPFFLVLGLVALALILQSNLSTLIIISAIACIIFFAANTPLVYNLGIWIAGAALAAAMVIFAPYRMQRFLTFLHPESDPLGVGYHINQALIAIGSGGLIGSGLGFSSQKLGFLPEATSDSIFAIYAEEMGFIGCLFLIGAFLMFTVTSFFIFKKSADSFNKLVAIGIGSWITIQAFVNIGAMTGLMPLSGTPLPFITAGGTHLIVELIACGILLKISTQIRED